MQALSALGYVVGGPSNGPLEGPPQYIVPKAWMDDLTRHSNNGRNDDSNHTLTAHSTLTVQSNIPSGVASNPAITIDPSLIEPSVSTSVTQRSSANATTEAHAFNFDFSPRMSSVPPLHADVSPRSTLISGDRDQIEEAEVSDSHQSPENANLLGRPRRKILRADDRALLEAKEYMTTGRRQRVKKTRQ